MKSQPLVSIITIFLNEEKFIHEAIESVQNQTYTNWELLLIDDGSDDASTEIAQSYAKMFNNHIRYLEHEGHQNCGTSASRNLGLNNARGDFIAFLDADDIWLPWKLETQVPTLLAQPEAGMLYGTTLFWHDPKENSENRPQDFVQKLGVKVNRLIEPPRLLTLLLEKEDTHPTNCSTLVRRQLCEDVDGFEETFGGLYEDTAFLAKAYLKAPVFVTGDCSAIYRQRANSSCHVAVKTGQYHHTEPNAARGAFLRWLETYLLTQRISDAGLWRALKHELWPYTHPTSYRVVQLIKKLPIPGRRLLGHGIRRGLVVLDRQPWQISRSRK